MSSYRQQGYRPQAAAQRNNGRGAAAGRSAKAKPRGRAKRRGHPFRSFFLLVLFALLATGGVMGYMMYDEIGSVERMNTFYHGVYVDGTELYGATPTEAAQYLYDRALAEISNFSVQLSFEGKEWRIDADMLGMTQALDARVREEINKAFMVGREGTSILDRYQTIQALKTEPYQGFTSGVDKNMAQIDKVVAEIQAAAYIPPKDASQVFDTTRQYAHVINAEENGREIDMMALKSEIVERVNTMQSGVIPVTTMPIQPAVTQHMLENEMVLIADVSTKINKISTPERTANVELGCSRFNGMTVNPGETVSFNKVAGKRTEKNGYYKALEIAGVEFQEGVGGGICQVSTTLYQAVIEAGLQVVSRTNHAIPVNYAEMGADATVADDRIDFRFKNNTDKPIRIVARVVTSGGSQICQFQIYGRPIPNDYKYSLRHEKIEEIPIPSPTKVPDWKQEHVRYVDQSKEVAKGSVGYKVRTYLVTKDSSGHVVEEKEISLDTYKAVPPTVYVGVEKRP